MEDNLKSISTDLFYKVRSRFSGLKLGKETGEVTINPEEAVFFDFDYMEGENPLGHVSISLAEQGNMKVYYSTGIAESMSPVQKNGWYDFLRSLREFAKRRLMSFDTRDITKDNLDKRDYAFLSQYSNNSPVGESIMKEGMYGSSKTSYQKLENTKLIVKHSKQVDETSPGARTRNITGLFIENGDGERFKYPFIHLAGARAMQRHVQEGGLPYDEIGRHIVSMSEQIAQLKNFGNYVVRNDLMNSETNGIVERSSEALNRLREEIKKLARRGHYEQFRAGFQEQQINNEIPQDVIEDLTNKFTVKNFKEDIKSVFPIIYNLMKEDNKEIGYDDVVALTTEDTQEEELLPATHETSSEFDRFESWVLNLGEESAIQSSDEEEKTAAVEKLQSLVGQHFPAGTDGTNAIQALKGIIEDPQLSSAIKQASKEDADSCVRPLVYQWLEQNAPDALEKLDFGDMEQPEQGQDQAAPGAEQEQPEQEEASDPNHPEYKKKDDYDLPPGKRGYGTKDYEKPDWRSHDDRHKRDFRKRSGQQESGMRELAEFIGSFYDKESGTFPKGPEGVCTMVGKKYGEQAEAVARKFVERMAPQQSTQQSPELAELARIKELVKF